MDARVVAGFILLGFIVVNFSEVQCQTAIEREVRANLTKLIKFVVGPAAEPNADLINMAFAMGGSPKTQEERIRYLEIMKQIARNTPEIVKNYTNTVTNADGTKTETLDTMAMYAAITMRALEYIGKQGEEQQQQSGATTVTTPAPTTTTIALPPTKPAQAYPTTNPPAAVGSGSAGSAGSATSFGSAVDSFSNTLQTELDGVRKIVQNQVSKSMINTGGTDGTVSLLDLFNMNRAFASYDQSQMNSMNNNQMGFF